jgi:dephospho-CoA kinase
MHSTHEKIILAIIGPIGSGKGTAASYLERRYGARIFKSSAPLRQVLQTLNQEVSRENMQLLSRILREGFGQDAIAQVAKRDMAEFSGRVSIFDGARRPEDLNLFVQMENFFLIYVDADVETRYARVVARAENGGDSEKTYEGFLQEELGEAESRTKAFKDIAHFVVDNSGDEATFNEGIEAVIGQILAA